MQPRIFTKGGAAVQDYIIDQTEPNIASLSCGLTSVGHGGCGPVAVYNACRMLGDRPSLGEILKAFRENRGFVLWGLAGSKTGMLLRWFRAGGYRAEKCTGFPRETGVYILRYWFWTKKFPFVGSHFVAYRQEGEQGTYYNVCSGAKAPLHFRGTAENYLRSVHGFAPTVLKVCKKSE